MLREFLALHPEYRFVDDIDQRFCDQYVEWRIHRGDARGLRSRHRALNLTRVLKPTTARNDLIALQAAIRFCWQNRKLAQPVPVNKPAASSPRPRFLTREEATRLLAAALGWEFAKQPDSRWRAVKRHHNRINYHLARLILIGLFTGTRSDRMRRLMWMENLGGGWIDLDGAILDRKARNEPNTQKRAPSVPLPDMPTADNHVNKLRAHLPRWRRLSSRYVIEHNGKPIKNSVFTSFASASRLAGLKDVTPHTLRHTCVTWLLEQDMPPWRVGQYVGMSVQMVDRVYGHINDEMQRETANAFGGRRSYDIPTKYPKKA
jgi:integrase